MYSPQIPLLNRDADPVPAGINMLCLTGGGILGRYTLECLIALEDRRKDLLGEEAAYGGRAVHKLKTGFDIIAGTSVGSLIAAAVAVGADLNYVADVMESRGKEIFHQTRFHKGRYYKNVMGGAKVFHGRSGIVPLLAD